ncbi:hypothetical protein BH11BAC4_BH11BAC4_19980 [soil metagenome]
MKKIKFSVQIFILAVSFPVLFITGISSPKKKTTCEELKQELLPEIQKKMLRENAASLRETIIPGFVIEGMMFKT